jgi:hypothetical protein
MNSEELKKIWSQQPSAAGVVKPTPEFIWRLADESTRFKRTIFWRDVREWLVTIFFAGYFLYLAFKIDSHVHWPLIVSAIILCVPMTYVALRKPKRPFPEASATLADYLRNSIADVQHQLGLLRSVARWYLGPIALSGTIFLADVTFSLSPPSGGQLSSVGRFLIAASIGAAVFYVVWKINQYAARKHLEPLLQRLRQTLAEIENE